MNRISFDFYEVLNTFKNTSIDYNNYAYIPAVKYKDKIQELCKNLFSIGNIHIFCPAIILNNNMAFYTVNHPDLAVTYMTSGMFRADNYFYSAAKSLQSVIYPRFNNEEKDFLQSTVTNILENEFKVYNSYCLIRRCDDCTVLIAIAHDYPHENVEFIYSKTIDAIEDLAIEYFNALMSVYVDNLPSLKYSRFATDKSFRKRIIKNRNKIEMAFSLSEKETQCLYWSSRGKTSSEIALLMNISEHTVNEHKKSILKKLNVSNIAHAIREAIKLKFIV